MRVLVSVVIPTRNNAEFLAQCISSLSQQDVDSTEVIVVDNGSTDDSIATVKRRFPHVKIVEVGYNAFFCESVNLGIATAQGEYVALVNDDTEFTGTWLSSTLEAFHWSSDIGSVASKILSLRDKRLIDSAGDHLMVNGYAGNLGWSQSADSPRFNWPDEVFSASAAGAVYRRDLLLRIGGFDESFVAYYDDIDVGFRLQLLGFRCAYNPRAIMYHYGGGSPKSKRTALRLVERNMVLNLVKNMPNALLRKYIGEILRANLSPIELYKWSDEKRHKRYASWILGKIGAIPLVSKAFQKRRLVQSSRRISIEYLDNLLLKHRDIDVASDMLPVHSDDEYPPTPVV